mmetsp:Transcript_9946/g.23947  ORF Transcript_9946/g.23947 Transcript_9946/m.23947 type:complete len:230 (-) Transcript_9946:88-777(-)
MAPFMSRSHEPEAMRPKPFQTAQVPLGCRNRARVPLADKSVVASEAARHADRVCPLQHLHLPAPCCVHVNLIRLLGASRDEPLERRQMVLPGRVQVVHPRIPRAAVHAQPLQNLQRAKLDRLLAELEVERQTAREGPQQLGHGADHQLVARLALGDRPLLRRVALGGLYGRDCVAQPAAREAHGELVVGGEQREDGLEVVRGEGNEHKLLGRHSAVGRESGAHVIGRAA